MDKKLMKNKAVALLLIILGIINTLLTNDLSLIIVVSIVSAGLFFSKEDLIS